MKPKEMLFAFREALALHELFRRAGFTSDDIYIGHDPKQGVAFVEVRAGERHFHVVCGSVEMPERAFRDYWAQCLVGWNDTFSEDDCSEIWNNSLARLNAVEIIAAMRSHGICSPVTAN